MLSSALLNIRRKHIQYGKIRFDNLPAVPVTEQLNCISIFENLITGTFETDYSQFSVTTLTFALL
jgi:hypothetical protein